MMLGCKTALQTNVSFEHEKGKKNNLIFLNYHLQGNFLKGKNLYVRSTMDILMYSIMLYLHTSTHATSYIGLIQQDRGYNQYLTLEGAISLFSVTKSQALWQQKTAVFDALRNE